MLFFGLEPADSRQLDLFADPAGDGRADQLSAAMDEINRRYGRGTVFHLAEGIRKPWSMKRSMLTPGYTTNWDQLPKVK